MKGDYAKETFENAASAIFKEHEEISYLSIVDDTVKIIAQKGFLEVHPSKLEKFHIQALLMAKVCDVSSESFGTLQQVCASFNDKYEVVVIPLSKRLCAIAVLAHAPQGKVELVGKDIKARLK